MIYIEFKKSELVTLNISVKTWYHKKPGSQMVLAFVPTGKEKQGSKNKLFMLKKLIELICFFLLHEGLFMRE